MNVTEGKCSKRWKLVLAVLAIGLALCFMPKRPPVFLEFRSGILSDGVLVVRNVSDKTLTGSIALFKPGESNGIAVPLLLQPGERREFGMLQVGDYAPAVGSHGYVDIDGYLFVRQFELVEKNLFSEFSQLWLLAH